MIGVCADLASSSSAWPVACGVGVLQAARCRAESRPPRRRPAARRPPRPAVEVSQRDRARARHRTLSQQRVEHLGPQRRRFRRSVVERSHFVGGRACASNAGMPLSLGDGRAAPRDRFRGAPRTRGAHCSTVNRGRRRRPTSRTSRRPRRSPPRGTRELCHRVTPISCRCEPQRPNGVVQPRFHRALRDLQIVGDLCGRPALVVRPADHRAVFLGQLCSGRVLSSIRSKAESTSSGPARSATFSMSGVPVSLRNRALRRSSMIMLRATVNSHARADRSTSSVTSGWLPSAQQRLLHHILRSCLVPGKPQGIAPQCGGVLVVEHPHHGGLRIVHYQPPSLIRGWRSIRFITIAARPTAAVGEDPY